MIRLVVRSNHYLDSAFTTKQMVVVVWMRGSVGVCSCCRRLRRIMQKGTWRNTSARALGAKWRPLGSPVAPTASRRTHGRFRRKTGAPPTQGMGRARGRTTAPGRRAATDTGRNRTPASGRRSCRRSHPARPGWGGQQNASRSARKPTTTSSCRRSLLGQPSSHHGWFARRVRRQARGLRSRQSPTLSAGHDCPTLAAAILVSVFVRNQASGGRYEKHRPS